MSELSIPEAARHLGVPYPTLDGKVRAGQVEIVWDGGVRRITEEALAKLQAGPPLADTPDQGTPEIPSGTWIYFIQQGAGGPIKIGKSNRVPHRMATIQIGSVEQVYLRLAYRALENEERVLHERFREDRIRGEWFQASEELLGYIRERQQDPLSRSCLADFEQDPFPAIPRAWASEWPEKIEDTQVRDLLTMDAAAILSVELGDRLSSVTLRDYAASGRLPAIRVGSGWFTSALALRWFLDHRPGIGRPRIRP